MDANEQLHELDSRVDKIQETLATEMLKEIKATSRRWFIAFIVTLVLWFGTIGVFLWYISLPAEETVSIENEDGNANYIGNDMNGDITNGENNSEETESSAP